MKNKNVRNYIMNAVEELDSVFLKERQKKLDQYRYASIKDRNTKNTELKEKKSLVKNKDKKVYITSAGNIGYLKRNDSRDSN